MTLTDIDVVKIRKALKPDFDNLETNLKKEIKLELEQSETRIKQYIHEGVNAVVDGVDNLLNEKQFDIRIKNLEKIHPQSRHRSLN